MKLICLYLSTALAVCGGERATYDSAGKLTSVIQNGAELPVQGGLNIQFTGGLNVQVQPHDQRTPITRDGSNLSWKGTATFPNTGKVDFTADWTEKEATISLQTSVVSPGNFPLDLASVAYVIDLPRAEFVGGTIGDKAVKFPAIRPTDPAFFRQTVDRLTLENSQQTWKLALALDQPRAITIVDHWDKTGRSYRIHISLHSGALPAQTPVSFGFALTTEARPQQATAQVRVDLSQPGYAFDGFGGNYCFDTETPVVEYTMDHLPSAWTRLELKAQAWDREGAQPGSQLKRDFELMQRAERGGNPWILSLWRLPERFYIDPNQRPFSTFGRNIASDRWPEFLDLLIGYFAYLKANYQAEPDLFSFNEPDLGVSIGFTAEAHRDMVKRIGARFAAAGIKTKMLLGDTANPRDSHLYVLPSAQDAEAMRYVGGLSFHSWGNGSAEQYRAWADVARWTDLPLIIGEAGTDPGSYRNKVFDSYAYGLKEALQYQLLLRDARPLAILYWQYTEDYGLVRKLADGSIEPTGRFWLMKHFVELSPRKGQVVASTSDQKDVEISAFLKGGAITVHLLNLGADRDVVLAGLPSGTWKMVTTVETSGFQSQDVATTPKQLRLPARSMVSLVKAN